MPLYFLHHRCETTYITDPEGADFPDLAGARIEAVLAARHEMSRTVRAGYIDLSAAFEIEGPDGECAFVRFSDAVSLRGPLALSVGARCGVS